MGKVDKAARANSVMERMPGTSEELALRTGLSIGIVKKILRELQDSGAVRFGIRHFSSLAYTRVYLKTETVNKDNHLTERGA